MFSGFAASARLPPVGPNLFKMKTAITVRPLTKRKLGGALYERPKRIQAAIGAALQIPLGGLLEMAVIADRNHAHYLPPEYLLYLVRNALRAGDAQTRDAPHIVLPSRDGAGVLKGEKSRNNTGD
jgi:hypothetical protein